MEPVHFRIARPTNQLSAITLFYMDGLGLSLVSSFKDHAGYDGVMLGFPGHEYHLEFIQHEKEIACPIPSNENLLVFYFDSQEKYIHAVERLKGMGVVAVEPENPYWTGKGETFEDPDGWRVVLFNGNWLAT